MSPYGMHRLLVLLLGVALVACGTAAPPQAEAPNPLAAYPLTPVHMPQGTGSDYPPPLASPPPTVLAAPLPTLTPTRTPFPTAVAALPPGPKLVYSEYQADRFLIWALSVVQPDQRRILVEIPRAFGTGLRASISPDQRMIAYTTIPDDAPRTDRYSADLWVVDLAAPTPRRLARQVFVGRYMHYPIWSPDSQWLIIERISAREPPYEQQIRKVQVSSGSETLLVMSVARSLHDAGRQWIVPLGWSQEGHSFYYQRGDAAPIELWRVDDAAGSAATQVGHSDAAGYPVCFFLAPDTSAVLCTLRGATPSSDTVLLLPLREGKTAIVLAEQPSHAPDPVWHPNGEEVVVYTQALPTASLDIQLINRQNRTVQAMPVPLPQGAAIQQWSPDGAWFAAYSPPTTDGEVYVVQRAQGTMVHLAGITGLNVIGWISGDVPGDRR